MQKNILIISGAILIILVGGFFVFNNYVYNAKQTDEGEVTLVISGYGYEIGDIVEIDATKTPQVGDVIFYDANINKSYCGTFGPGVDLAKITGVSGTQVSFEQSSFMVNGEDFSIENNRIVPFLFGSQKYENIPSNNLVIAQGEFMGDKWIGRECPGEVDETGNSVVYNRFTIKEQAIKGVIIRKVGHDSEFAEERKNIVY